jgi:hypothetical protein
MKKLAFASLILAAFVGSGCIKTAADSTVNNDGTASVKMKFSYKKEVIENLKSMIEAQMGGEDGDAEGGEAAEGFKKFEAGFDDKKVAEEWKKLGLEVAKSATTDKDGWKGVEIEGSVKNISEYNRKHADAMKKIASEAEDNPMNAMSQMDPGKLALPGLPRFYKTAQPNVAKIVMNSTETGAQNDKMAQFEEMGDEEREQFEMALDQMRGMFGLDDMKIEMRIKLPGKILSVSNAKQDGPNTLVFELLGSNFNVDTMANMAKTKGQISATLEFDPKEFKIPLEDEPKAADSKPAKPADAAKPKKDEEEKKKKEDEK